MSTSLLQALDFSWDHSSDMLWQAKNLELSIWERMSRRISDYAVYIFAYLLGVEIGKLAAKRIPAETKTQYDEYVSKNSYLELKNQPVILVLNGEQDIAAPPENFQQLEEQSRCKIVFLKAAKLTGISVFIDNLKKSSNQIKLLWVRAHGTPFSINFGGFIDERLDITSNDDRAEEYNRQEIEKTQRFIQEQFNQLEPDAPIILESCFTGQETSAGEKNIAQFIADAVKRKVYAPSREALSIKAVTFSQEEGFQVVMTGFQNSTYFAQGSFLARLSAILHAYRNHYEDITRIFDPKTNSG